MNSNCVVCGQCYTYVLSKCKMSASTLLFDLTDYLRNADVRSLMVRAVCSILLYENLQAGGCSLLISCEKQAL